MNINKKNKKARLLRIVLLLIMVLFVIWGKLNLLEGETCAQMPVHAPALSVNSDSR